MRRYLVLGLALVALGSCSSSGGDGTGPSVAVALVTVAPALDTVYIGAVSQFTATTKDADGNVLTGRTVTWSKTGTGATVSSTGLVTGTATGDVTVTATSEGITGNAGVVVRPVPVVSVLLTPPTDTIYLGATATLTATPRDSIGGTLTGRVTTWSSLDAAASVNNAGLVTSLSLGTARIVAYVEGKGDTSVVTVLPVPVASVVITPSADTLYPTSTVQLAAVTRDSADNILAGRVIAWNSLDAAASVNGTGLVTANSLGTARIVATSEGKADTTLITVAAVPVSSIVVTPAVDTLYPTNTVQLAAVTRDSASNVLTGRVVVWSALDAAASVNGTGLVTASAVGTARIVAISEGKADTALVTVLAVPVSALLLTPDSAHVNAGATVQFSASPRDSVGGALAGRVISWSTLDTTVATVSISGLVTGVAAGTTALIAVSEGKGDTGLVIVDTLPTPVVPLTGTWIGGGVGTLNGAFTILFQFQQTDSVLTGTWGDGGGGDAGTITGVVSGNSALIQAAGTNGGPCTSDWAATRVGPDSLSGTFQSSAGCPNSNSGSIAVHRVAATASVVITASVDTMTLGDSAQFSAEARDSGNTILNDRGIRWSSSDTTIVTVGQSGQVHAIGLGATWIVALAQGRLDSVRVSVVAPSGTLPPLAGTWVANGVSSLDGPIVVVPYLLQTDSTLSGSWYSSGPDHNSGILDGSVHGDSVEIIFHDAGPGCDAIWTTHRVGADSLNGSFIFIGGSCLHPTNNGPLSARRDVPTAQVVILGAPDSLSLGDSLQFVAEARDSTGAVIADRPVAWTSGDTTVVSITGGGVAHAVGLGTTLLVAEGQGRADTVAVRVVSAPSSVEFPIAVTNLLESAGGLAGDGTNVLVGYHQEPIAGLGTEVKFVLLDGSGAAIAPVVATGIIGDPPTVAYGGGQYLGIWARHDSGAAALTGLFINSAGAATGGTFPIRAGGVACGVAYAGGTFGVLYYDENLPDSVRSVYFRRIAPNGALGPEIVVAAAPSGCQLISGMLASNGTGFLATFERPDGSEVRTRTISTSDALGAMNVVRSALGGLGLSHVAAIPGGWVAVWNEFGAGVHTAYAVLAPDGSGSTSGQLGEAGGTEAIVFSLRGTPDGFVAGWFERPADSSLTVTKVARYNVGGVALAPPTTIAGVVSGKFAIPYGIEPVGGGFLILLERASLSSGIVQLDEETADLWGIIVSP